MALPKVYRLVIQKSNVGKIRKTGASIHTSLLSAFYVPNQQPASRFGIVIGTGISKKAVVRNRIRRVLQEVLFAQRENVQAKVDMIIYPKKIVTEKEDAQLIDDCKILLQKIKKI